MGAGSFFGFIDSSIQKGERADGEAEKGGTLEWRNFPEKNDSTNTTPEV